MRLVLAWLASASAITLRTKGRVQNVSPRQLHAYLATPDNWPKIVASSVGVEGSTDKPLGKGGIVTEVFGLPPVLPLKVTWTCANTDATNGLLDVRSADGLPGVARDCRMLFNVESDGGGGSNVILEMSYAPASPFATLAAPVLVADNWIALNVLLQQALDARKSIDKFRELMGGLYGVAGLAHLYDLTLGPSALFAAADAPGFYALPFEGQACAIAWCAAGPAAWILSRDVSRGTRADAGLVIYGAVEIVGAGLLASIYGSPDAIWDAVLVQAVIRLAWLYSKGRDRPAM
ncbi:hypothetical protein M885DRAFT_466834 [Pelagophyceae sp. CCMP2097]|nr:hypothetical protein M885DRAFT_466834 [Pelagophyceae sp. CCMP2097]